MTAKKHRVKPQADAEKVRHARAHLEAIVTDAALIPMSVLRPRITRVEVRCIATLLDELHRLNVAIAMQGSLLHTAKTDLEAARRAAGIALQTELNEKHGARKPQAARSPQPKGKETNRK